jgi:glutamate-ammonia-ligase adenylyltransferase
VNRTAEFSEELLAALTGDAEDDADKRLARFLESRGYTYGLRSATNLRLLALLVPADTLPAICLAALAAPMPDMALNGLERVSGLVPREEFVAACGKKGRLAQLLTLCGSSPFLVSILCREPHLFSELFTLRGIETRRRPGDSLAALRARVGDETDTARLMRELRRFKHAEILRIAARDLSGLAPLEEVTVELSCLAAAVLQVAYDAGRRRLIAEHGLPMMVTPTGEREAEMTILGMGKFGGCELNFSSDIDLMYFYSSDQGETSGVSDGHGGVKGRISLHTFFVKLAEKVTKVVSQVTADGFVFRVDLGLRPEGRNGEICISQRAAELYYESWGQSWERAAMLKARPVAGSLELGAQLLAGIHPFIYRKYLDYTLIEDMMAMKQKIDASLTRDREGEYNLKLGRGGIREIEFFIQALQLVYAGKNQALRQRNSLRALAALREARIINDEDCATLSEAYRFLRTVEHRIQVVQERQTHSLPRKEEEMTALARRCGFLRSDGLKRFRATLETHRGRVSAVYGALFLSREERLTEEAGPEVLYFFDPKADADLLKDMLAERHFERVDAAYDNILILRDGPPRAHLTERARRLLGRIAPLLLQEIFSSPDPDLALTNLERFMGAVGSRSSYYALLAENREILKLLVSLFGMSEFLSKIFVGHPELLDSMVSRSHAASVKAWETMAAELALVLDAAESFEERLDALRRFRHEEFLRIGMNDVYGKMGQTEIAGQLTLLAEVCLQAAYRMARVELARFGIPTWTAPGGAGREAAFAVLGMGKLGGNELNYHSDLDIIYIYDYQGMTNGDKSISNHEYFAKLGQKVISILTTQTREGYVYKIDTRLRPSGNAGPLVTSLESFRDYHRREAQIWERQALTKARVVVGEGPLREAIEEVCTETVYGSGADEAARGEIHRLRMRMETELARERAGSYNIKTGRGGMVDVEFIVQYLQLRHGREIPEIRGTNTLAALKALGRAGILPEAECDTLVEGYKFLRRLENRLRIIHDYSMNDLGGSASYMNKLARRLGYDVRLKSPGQALMHDYERITAGVREVYDRILGGE